MRKSRRSAQTSPTEPIRCCFHSWIISYLDFLSIDFKQSLAEVHADRGLRPAGELSGAQPVREAGLTHPGVSNHEHLERPAAREQ